MFRIGLPLVLLATLIAACSSISEEQCKYGDWEVLGQQDGSRGTNIGRFQRYAEDCGRYGVSADSEAYKRGRERGLDQFCTPVGAYTNGLKSRGNISLCGNNPDLLRIHRTAWEFNETRQQLNRARNAYDNIFSNRRSTRREIEKIRRRLRDPELSDDKRNELQRDLRRCYDNLDQYERDEYRLRFEIRDLEREFDRQTYEMARIEQEFGLRGSRY